MKIQINELETHLNNKTYVVGSDEVGYGAGCGQLVVCGVRAHKDWHLDGLNDSKKLSPARREVMRAAILKQAQDNIINYYIAERTNTEIDKYGLGVCLKDCYVEIFKKLYTNDSLLICDGNLTFDNPEINSYDQVSIVKADTMIPSVQAASILAKTHRDAQMIKLHQQYPQYDFISNMGYLSAKHIDGIKKFGYSPLHRLSYKIKALEK